MKKFFVLVTVAAVSLQVSASEAPKAPVKIVVDKPTMVQTAKDKAVELVQIVKDTVTKENVQKFVTNPKVIAATAATVTAYVVYKAVKQCNWVRKKLGLKPVVKAGDYCSEGAYL